ncbi:MAG TPA: hypothetical protein PK336_01425 [Methanoculleus sp.]|jgi:hypothetical protein|nr:MAG: hypothetical protein BWY89_00424 [Bacteroidetes bacterium ADurb.BinA012]HQN90915.1 hypothetical protein [Methanoculleus sp.]
MSEIDPALFEFYRAVATDGGGIGTSLMVSSTLNNEFDRISSNELLNGTTRYSKQFIKNLNASDWNGVVIYFEALTTRNPYTEISMCPSGSKSKLYDSVTLSGHATVTASGYFETSSDLRLELGAGEMVFNYTDDTVAFAGQVSEVTETHVILKYPYGGTLGAGKVLAVAPATMSMYVYPKSQTGIVVYPPVTIPAGAAIAVWKKYRVIPGCPQYANDWFTLKIEEV